MESSRREEWTRVRGGRELEESERRVAHRASDCVLYDAHSAREEKGYGNAE